MIHESSYLHLGETDGRTRWLWRAQGRRVVLSPEESPVEVLAAEDTENDRTLKTFDKLDDQDVHVGSLSTNSAVTNESQSTRIEIEDESREIIARRFSEPVDLSDTHLEMDSGTPFSPDETMV